MQVTGLSAHFKISLIIINAGIVSAQTFPDAKVDSLIRKGITLTLSAEYQEAKNTFKELEKEFPDLPAGKIFIISPHIAESSERMELEENESIGAMIDEAEIAAEKYAAKNHGSIWANYFLGVSRGYSAYYRATKHKYLSAINEGYSSVKDFEKCIEADKNFYEAYIAVGTYKYWVSAKTEFINWLPFFSDEKELGTKLLEKAVGGNSYHFHLAIYSLCWVYISRDMYSKALDLAEKALKFFPESKDFHFIKARVYSVDNPLKAAAELYKIRELFLQHGTLTTRNDLWVNFAIARNLNNGGKYSEALDRCNYILGYKPNEKYSEDLLDRIERTKELKLEILENQRKK